MAQQQPPPPITCSVGRFYRVPLLLIMFFLLLMLAGIGWGEPERVLEQARAVCLACIGIG